MSIAADYSERLVEDLGPFLEWHFLAVHQAMSALVEPDLQDKLASELLGEIQRSLMIFRRVSDQVSILERVAGTPEAIGQADPSDIAELILVLAAAAELARRSRATAGPIWDLIEPRE